MRPFLLEVKRNVTFQTCAVRGGSRKYAAATSRFPNSRPKQRILNHPGLMPGFVITTPCSTGANYA